MERQAILAGGSIDLVAMRQAVQKGRVEWRRHALERMLERGIVRAQVIRVLLEGERIEDYPGASPWPGALFLCLIDDRPLHVVVAFRQTSDCVAVITAYEPDEEHFEPGFRSRRK